MALLFGAVACVEDLPVEIVPPQSEGRLTLEVSSESGFFEAADADKAEVRFLTRGGEVVLDVLTNQAEWRYDVVEGGDWLSVSADDYFLTIAAEANGGTEARSGVIEIRASRGQEEACFEVAVRQNHSGNAEVVLGQNSLRVKAHTELQQIVAVESNVDEWSFDCTCSWLLVEQCEEGLRLTADDNKFNAQRTTKIRLTVPNKEDALCDELTVMQDGNAFVVLSSHNVATDDGGGERHIILTSNPELEWGITTDGSDWFTATKGEGEIVVTVASNANGLERFGTVEVVVGDEDNLAKATLRVHQIGTDTDELIYEVEITEPDYTLIAAPVLTLSSGGSISVDWGDGSEVEVFDSRRGSHIYKEPGLYTISITGEAKSLEFSDGDNLAPELKNIISWGLLGLTNAADMCLGCNNLESIPNDVAGSFAGVKSFIGAFSCCESLREIPEGLFRYATVAKNFEDCFSHSGSISAIPEGLFANCAAAEDFSYTFYGTGSGYIVTNVTLGNLDELKTIVSAGKLTSIPADLFAGCPKAKQLDYTFGATAIKEVPEALFSYCTNATIFTGAFSACVNLDSVPKDFLSKATSATDIKYLFAGCTSLKDLPVGMFTNNSSVTNLEYIFYRTGVEKLSAGLFEGLSAVKTIGAVFQDCVALSEIEEGVFDGVTAAKSFKYCFSGCTSLREIPEGLFRGLTAAYEFKSTFEDSALESIPEALFADARNYSSADFSYMLAGCRNLKTVPAGLFETFTAVTSPGFKYAFSESAIETLPSGLFAKNTAVTQGFENTFNGCDCLTTIESGVFPESSSVSTLAYTFEGCTALESLPEGLFDPLAASKTKFTATFKNCTALKTLPAGLFAQNSLAAQFSDTFNGCSSLESLPADLLGSKEKITTVKGMFKDCKSLKTIPAELFAQSPAITSFESTFSGCESLTELPAELFAAIGTKTSSITFSECFMGCSSLVSLPAALFDTVRRINYIDSCFNGCSSLTGESPYTIIVGDDGVEQKVHLYERTRGTEFLTVPSSTSAHEDCFAGCSGLDDYDLMPSSWQ